MLTVRRSMAVAVGLVVALLLALFAPSIQSAHAVSHTTEIRASKASSYCVDVKGGKDISGETVWLVPCTNGNSEHWIEMSAHGSVGVNFCASGACVYFADAQNHRLCLGLNAGEKANLGKCDTERDWWVLGANHTLRNAYFGDYLTAASRKDEAAIYGQTPRTKNGLYQWTGPN